MRNKKGIFLEDPIFLSLMLAIAGSYCWIVMILSAPGWFDWPIAHGQLRPLYDVGLNTGLAWVGSLSSEFHALGLLVVMWPVFVGAFASAVLHVLLRLAWRTEQYLRRSRVRRMT